MERYVKFARPPSHGNGLALEASFGRSAQVSFPEEYQTLAGPDLSSLTSPLSPRRALSRPPQPHLRILPCVVTHQKTV